MAFVCVCVCVLLLLLLGEPWSTQTPAAPADEGRVLPACTRVCPVAAANPQPAGCNHHSRQAVCYCGATRPILRVEAWLRESRSRFATLQAHARRRAARRRLPAKAKPGRGARAGGTQAAQPRPVDCGSKRSNPSRIRVMVPRSCAARRLRFKKSPGALTEPSPKTRTSVAAHNAAPARF